MGDTNTKHVSQKDRSCSEEEEVNGYSPCREDKIIQMGVSQHSRFCFLILIDPGDVSF